MDEAHVVESGSLVALIAAGCSGLLAPAAKAWTWTTFLTPADHAVHLVAPGSPHRILVTVTQGAFHSCGWSNAVSFNSSVIGDQMFNSALAMFLSGKATEKRLALLVEGCDGDRAAGLGIKFEN